jgi:hypothetical protein
MSFWGYVKVFLKIGVLALHIIMLIDISLLLIV